MGKIFEKGHNWIHGKGAITHKQRDAKWARKHGFTSDEAKAQGIITALTPLSDPNRPMGP